MGFPVIKKLGDQCQNLLSEAHFFYVKRLLCPKAVLVKIYAMNYPVISRTGRN